MGATQNRAELYQRLSAPLLDFIWTHRNTLVVDKLIGAFNELDYSMLSLERIGAQVTPERTPELVLVFNLGMVKKPAGTLVYNVERRIITYSLEGTGISPARIDHVRACWHNALIDLAALAEVQVKQQVSL